MKNKYFICCAVMAIAVFATVNADAGIFGNRGGILGFGILGGGRYSACSSSSARYSACSSSAMQYYYSPPPVNTSFTYQPTVERTAYAVDDSKIASPAPTP